MGFRKISTKLMAMILPLVVIAMVTQMAISAANSSEIIEEQIADRMNAELTAQSNKITECVKTVTTMCGVIAKDVQTNYNKTVITDYEKILGNTIKDEDMVLGSGLWFEPYVYDKGSEYMGPYIYKDGSEIVTTWDYSNADYDYFNEEYYLNAKNSKTVKVTDPYYDPTSGIVMASSSGPMFNSAGEFIGCVTVDMQLDDIQSMVSSVKIGEAGTAMLLSSRHADDYEAVGIDAHVQGIVVAHPFGHSVALGQKHAAPVILGNQTVVFDKLVAGFGKTEEFFSFRFRKQRGFCGCQLGEHPQEAALAPGVLVVADQLCTPVVKTVEITAELSVFTSRKPESQDVVPEFIRVEII